MASDTVSRSSSVSAESYGLRSFPVINQVVRKHLEEAMTLIPEPTSSTGCLLTDIGNSLIQTSTIMSHLAHDLIRGDHIDDNTRRVMNELENDNDFSEFELFDYVNKKHAVLRRMLHHFQAASTSIRQEWDDAPRLPIRTVPEMTDMDRDVPSSAGSQSPPMQAPQMAQPSQLSTAFSTALRLPAADSWQPSPTSNTGLQPSAASHGDFKVFSADTVKADPIDIPNVDMMALKARGKGTYTCPYKMACKKGGVFNGELVMFERNCVFRAHLQKHQKPFKCHLPGCPNKGGFARIDQLRRHQEAVKHDR